MENNRQIYALELLEALPPETKLVLASAICHYQAHYDYEIGEFCTEESRKEFLGLSKGKVTTQAMVKVLFETCYLASVAWAEVIRSQHQEVVILPPKAGKAYPFVTDEDVEHAK